MANDVIISNYAELLIPLVAFLIVGSAAREIIASRKANLKLWSTRTLMIGFALFGILYCILIFQHFNLSSLSNTQNPYHLPIWLTLISLIIPYLYGWFIGLLAAYEIGLHALTVKGVIYRRALIYLAVGLATIILASIAVAYITSASPNKAELTLNFKLLLIIIFRILGGLGFIMLAIGASRLKKIEDL